MNATTCTDAATTVYVAPQLPSAWVVRRDGKLWIVPARANGWATRKTYRGHEPVEAGFREVAAHNLIGTGTPTQA